METTPLFGNEAEKKQHENAIRALAHEMGVPEDDVAFLYRVILRKYKSYARVTNFLSVLTFRKARYILKKRIEIHGKN